MINITAALEYDKHSFAENYMTEMSLFSNTAGIPSITEPIKFSYVDQCAPVFNLTCISTGGLPITVTWTRDGVPLPYDYFHKRDQTMTNDADFTYENVLTVKVNETGTYQCCVGNVGGIDCQNLTLGGKVFSKYTVISTLCRTTHTYVPIMNGILYSCILYIMR